MLGAGLACLQDQVLFLVIAICSTRGRGIQPYLGEGHVLLSHVRPLQDVTSMWNTTVICDATNHIICEHGFMPIQLVQSVYVKGEDATLVLTEG